MTVIPMLLPSDPTLSPPISRTGLCHAQMGLDPGMSQDLVREILGDYVLRLVIPALLDGRAYCFQVGPIMQREIAGRPCYVQWGCLTLARRSDARRGEHFMEVPLAGEAGILEQRTATGWQIVPGRPAL